MAESIYDCAKVYVADLGTSGPTNTTDAWPAGFTEVGLLAEDSSITRSGLSGDVTQYRDFCNKVLRSIRRGETRTVQFTALEDTDLVFGLINPGSTSVTDGVSGETTRTIQTLHPEDYRVFGFELTDGDVVKRWVMHKGMVTDVGDIEDQNSDLTMYEITVTAHDSNGSLITEITNDPGAAVPA